MKISIITVCLNSEKTILANLNSILSQTYKNIEHILVDGGSTDNTLKYLNNYPNLNINPSCQLYIYETQIYPHRKKIDRLKKQKMI